MQKQNIAEYTPAWLQKPYPGHGIFTSAPTKATSNFLSQSKGSDSASKRSAKPGPRRTIARRGCEIFVAVGKEIRWADLVYLKESWEYKEDKKAASRQEGDDRSFRESSQFEANHAQGYRTVKTPVADDIRQLVVSPNGNYLAILTTHTVHIAMLPDSSPLTAPDDSPMKLKTYTLGPTTHVTSQAGIASALWHPLGVNGTCLVTVTVDAVVRVWELSATDRWSFDRPTLAIDLKKLADGTSVDQDFAASVGANKSFSPDSVEMDVASACFAGRGSGGWSPMTLWVAMREGDVYALCPLLPEKWSSPPSLVPSLTVSIVAKLAATEDDPTCSPKAKALAQQQFDWMAEIDKQDPVHIETSPGDPPGEVFMRPSKPGKIPKLQGPFELELAVDESEEESDSLLSDIYIIGAKVDDESLMFGEEEDILTEGVDREGASFGVVCLLTSNGRLSICLDLDGVEAQWLPKTRSRPQRLVQEEFDVPSLLTFEVLDTSKKSEVQKKGMDWPVFSEDVTSRYSFYITNTSSISYISLHPWIFRLDGDLSDSSHGAEFRIDLMAKAEKSIRQRIYTQEPLDRLSPLAASTLIFDPDLRYFLLTATPHGPLALVFETSKDVESDYYRSQSRSPIYDPEPERPLILCEPRPVYEPSHTLDEDSALPAFIEKLGQSKYKRLLKEEIRLSPATLQIMAEAHKVLSEETHRIGTAAAELFRRCQRLQAELQSQIKKANDVASRVDAITGNDVEDGPTVSVDERISVRIKVAEARQKELTERIDRLRRKATQSTSRELSDKERAWLGEVKMLKSKVVGGNESDDDFGGREVKEPWARYKEADDLHQALLKEVEKMEQFGVVPQTPDFRVPSEVRKTKMVQIMSLLDRETALVEGAKSRLERLSLY
ncbi:hypothetical protein WAI453_012947 [Rhynchosporium graminicola]|uniref:Nuclear pore complex protein An-Nup82 n=1 Tax=Rhynchosporium graminicola TaxID=2792576 RepID=A0A1E1L9M6_9HELO|nr:uncharacterized protein RCO7_07251 [Rhynchosporium commune]